MRTSRLAIMGLVVIALSSGLSQAATKTSMPAAAKAEYDLGNAAFDQGDWDLAVQHFDAAREVDKRNPKILFNLGLSHSKAGHELPAVAWLEAYLVLVPADPKASDIRKEITRLTAAAEGKLTKMLKAAQEACDQLEENDSWSREEKHYLLRYLADSYLMSGNAAKALAVSNLAGPTIGLPYTPEEELYVDYSSSLVNDPGNQHYERTDPDAASEALDRYTSTVKAAAERPGGYDWWKNVCEAYYHQANWDGLRRSALNVADQEERQRFLDLADKKEAPDKPDRCGDWILLAEELSESPLYTDLEHTLKTVGEKDVFWTWTKDKGVRAVDTTWHVIEVAREWSHSLRDAASIRKFQART